VIGSDPATANVVKAAASFLMACVVEGMSDALTLVKAAGADPQTICGPGYPGVLTTPVYRYLSGAPQEVLAGGEASSNHLKSA